MTFDATFEQWLCKCDSYRIKSHNQFALAPAGVGPKTNPYELTDAGALSQLGSGPVKLGKSGWGVVRHDSLRFGKPSHRQCWVRHGKVTMTKVKETNRIVGAIGGEAPSNGARSGIELTMPYRVEVTIQGVAPILFHRWNCESVESKAKAKKGSAEKKTDDVESFVYRNDKGELGIPGEYLRAALVGAAKYRQDPRSPRKSAADLFKACIVSLTPLAGLGVKDWDYLDKRRCVIQRNAITRSRPAMAEGWKATFILMVNLPEYVDAAMLNETITAAGKFIGLGDFRPSFGRFQITGFKVLKD